MGFQVLLISSLVSTAVGTFLQMQQQGRAAKAASRRAEAAAGERQREEELQKRRADIVAARERRRAVAEATRFRAASVNLAANRGAGGSISSPGSTLPAISGNLTSQLNYNNSFINRVDTLNSQIRQSQSNTANILGTPISSGNGFGSALSALGSLGMGIAGNRDLRGALGFT